MTEDYAPTTRRRPVLPGREALLDEWLVTRIWSGDREAARLLAERWQPRLARTARRLLGEEEAALAAVQDSWLAILRGMTSLSDPARFPAWAFTILRRRCADAIGRRQAARSRDGGLAKDLPLPAQSCDSDERLAILQAFAALPSDQRLAAQLHFVEGLSLAEIAEVQAVPTGTVKSRLFHARRKLKAALSEPQLEGEHP